MRKGKEEGERFFLGQLTLRSEGVFISIVSVLFSLSLNVDAKAVLRAVSIRSQGAEAAAATAVKGAGPPSGEPVGDGACHRNGKRPGLKLGEDLGARGSVSALGSRNPSLGTSRKGLEERCPPRVPSLDAGHTAGRCPGPEEPCPGIWARGFVLSGGDWSAAGPARLVLAGTAQTPAARTPGGGRGDGPGAPRAVTALEEELSAPSPHAPWSQHAAECSSLCALAPRTGLWSSWRTVASILSDCV